MEEKRAVVAKGGEAEGVLGREGGREGGRGCTSEMEQMRR